MRTGGALVTRFVEQYITPNGDAEFYGATNVLRFDPGEVEKSVTIIAKGDGVPEVSGILNYVTCINSLWVSLDDLRHQLL